MKNVQILTFFISKKYRQRFFRFENFDYKRPLFFELRAVELAILFCCFLPISENYHKNVTLPECLTFLCPLTVKLQCFQFLAKFVENLFHWLIFFNFTNIRYLHLLMCLLHAKDNKAVNRRGSRKF